MDAASVSVLWYRRSKPLGKVRRRVQDLRIPSCSYYDFIASRPTLDLSHNESTRLAADSLLSRGLEGYHEVLSTEGEVDFLSELEKIYILDNGRDGSTADPGASDDDGKELKSFSAGSQSATRCPAMSTDSEPTAAGVKTADHVLDEPKFEVYFHSDSRAAGMKDLVREFIRKATMDLAIVMDSFSDAELLCDLLEASRKRNVSVYLLLDHLNLNLFVSMWQELKLDSKNFPKLSVRSVAGQTYCAKTGRKLTGQIAESFIITDWTEVLTGSYSFSWLSWQVHRSLAVLVKGSAVIPFHQEFHRLNSSSKPVPGFVTYISVPQTLPLYTTLYAAQNDKSDVKKSNQCSKATMQRPQRAGTGTQMHENPPQLYPTPVVEPGALQSAAGGKPKHTVGPVCSQHCAQTNTEPLKKNQNQIQAHITAAERNTMGQESNPPHTDSPAHGQNRSVHYQSPVKTHSNLEHYNEVPEGVFSQQRNRDRLIKPLGIAEALNTQRRQWYCPLNFKAKVDFVSDRPKLQTHSASQQTQAKMGFLLPLSNQRGPIHRLQANVSSLGTRRQNESQRHHQPPTQSHPTAEAPGSKSAPTVMGAYRKPQLQSDSKIRSQGPGTNLHPHPHPVQQVKPPPRLNWMPQSHTTRPRPVARHHSFGTTYGMGQQAGWRTFHSSMNASLGRSKSMNERHSAVFRGAGLNPNITKT